MAGCLVAARVDSNNVFSVGLGAFTGLVFWWIGIFRNKELPFVDRHFPIGVLIVLPIAAAGAYVHRALQPAFYQGRVISILAAPSSNPLAGQASVHLTGGRVVRADLSNTWPASMVLGWCVHLDDRWSTLRMHRVYGVFGGCGDCWFSAIRLSMTCRIGQWIVEAYGTNLRNTIYIVGYTCGPAYFLGRPRQFGLRVTRES